MKKLYFEYVKLILVLCIASLITIGCEKRYIRPHTAMMIHQLSGWAGGTYEKIKDGMKAKAIGMEYVYKIYAKHSNLSKKKIKKLLKRDYWMDADEAITKGFVDAVWRG